MLWYFLNLHLASCIHQGIFENLLLISGRVTFGWVLMSKKTSKCSLWPFSESPSSGTGQPLVSTSQAICEPWHGPINISGEGYSTGDWPCALPGWPRQPQCSPCSFSYPLLIVNHRHLGGPRQPSADCVPLVHIQLQVFIAFLTLGYYSAQYNGIMC